MMSWGTAVVVRDVVMVVGEGACIRLRRFVVCAGRVIGRRGDLAWFIICPGVLRVLARVRQRVRARMTVVVGPFVYRLTCVPSRASNDGSISACITWVRRWSLFKPNPVEIQL